MAASRHLGFLTDVIPEGTYVACDSLRRWFKFHADQSTGFKATAIQWISNYAPLDFLHLRMTMHVRHWIWLVFHAPHLPLAAANFSILFGGNPVCRECFHSNTISVQYRNLTLIWPWLSFSRSRTPSKIFWTWCCEVWVQHRSNRSIGSKVMTIFPNPRWPLIAMLDFRICRLWLQGTLYIQ